MGWRCRVRKQALIVVLAITYSLLAPRLAWATASATPAIQKTIEVAAPPEEVWRALTTVEGVRSFFAPEARIEPRKGGAYELYFVPTAPLGERGAEGCRVLAIDAPRRLELSWNFPPSIPSLRRSGAKSRVVLTLESVAGGTAITLVNDQYRDGDDWKKGREYFDHAWALVLERLRHRFAVGPIDWSSPWSPHQLTELAWLVGTWQGEHALERWDLFEGELAGSFVETDPTAEPARKRFLELMSISPVGSGLVLRIRMFDGALKDDARTRRGAIELHLHGLEGERATFAQPRDPQGTRLHYQRKHTTLGGNHDVVLEVSLEKKGKIVNRYALVARPK